MRRTFRYPLHPTRAQGAILLAWLEYCRQLYNAALEHRIGAHTRARRSVTLYDQHAELTELRAVDAEARAVPAYIERSALRRLDRAFQGFYRRCRAGGKPGFPRFRGKGRCTSFSFPAVLVSGDRVHIPKMGLVRFHRYRELEGKVREATIRYACGRWWVCFACDLGEAPPKTPVANSVGVDLGLTSFAVLSDGSEVDNPRYLQRGEELLASRQQRLTRRKRGSRSRERARLLVAKAHEHVRCQRLDFSRKLAASLFSRYALVAHEKLPIQNLVRGRLGKSIGDAAWGVFIHALACKAESAGKHAVAVDPRNTSATCSGCGAVARKRLKERRHECGCGLSIGRDHNAALNILTAGRAVAASASAEASHWGATAPADLSAAHRPAPREGIVDQLNDIRLDWR